MEKFSSAVFMDYMLVDFYDEAVTKEKIEEKLEKV